MCPHVSEQVEKWKQTLTGGKNRKNMQNCEENSKMLKNDSKLPKMPKWLDFLRGTQKRFHNIRGTRKSEVYSMEQKKGKKTAPRRSRTTCDMHADRRDCFFFFLKDILFLAK